MSFAIYFGAAWFNLYPVEVSAATSVIIAFGQSRKQRADLISQILEKYNNSSNWKPKTLLFPIFNVSMVIMFILNQMSDCSIQEGDYVTDAYVLFCLGFLWGTQPAHLRYKDRDSCLVVVLCIKMTYFLDR